MTRIEIEIVEQDNGRVVPVVRVTRPDGAVVTRREWRVEHVLRQAIPFAELPPRPVVRAPEYQPSWDERRDWTGADREFGSHMRELVSESSPLEWLVAKHLMPQPDDVAPNARG